MSPEIRDPSLSAAEAAEPSSSAGAGGAPLDGALPGPRDEAQPTGLFALIREALAGSDRDFTRGPIGQAIVLLSVPMVLEMMGESLFAICDTFFVSRLGSDAVATVGLTESVLTLVYAVAVGLAMATTAMVARRYGEHDEEGAGTAAVQAIALGVLVSLVVAGAGLIFAADILRLMGADEGVIASGSSYTRILLGGSTTIMLLFLLNAIFRGAGDASMAMWSLWLANGLNVILDPCLIFGLGPFPEMGIAGASTATTIGRGTAVLFQLWVLFNGRRRIRVLWQQLRLRVEVMVRLVRVSAWGIVQFLIATSSWIALMRTVSIFGGEAVAGYTIAIRIIVFAILPAWGMSNAAATLVGQNLGARKPERAERSVWRSARYNLYFLLGVAVVFIVFARQLVGFFTDDPEVLRYGIDALRFISYGYGFYAYGMVVTQAFNGAGDTSTPTKINFFCFWLFQVPLAYLLATKADLGPRGVFLAITVAESLLTLVSIVVFRRGYWKEQRI